MEDLDKKLGGIVKLIESSLIGNDPVSYEIVQPMAVREIKQAFIDAGWKDSAFLADHRLTGRSGEMTGQEWYDRYKKELENSASIHWERTPYEMAISVGKKASGIR